MAADTELLATLPDEEYASGLGEVAKAALLGAEGLLELLEGSVGAVRARDPGILADVVAACVAHKAGVVAGDEREAGRPAGDDGGRGARAPAAATAWSPDPGSGSTR